MLTTAKQTGVRTLTILLSLSATFLVLISTAPNGIALSPDSVAYVAAARSLSDGNGLTLFDSTPLTLWPPLYPAVLSAAQLLFGLDPVDGARIVNAALFGLIVYLSGLLFRRHLASSSFVILGLVTVFLSPALFGVSIFAWTEPLFILWTLLFLLLLDSYLKEGSTTLLIFLAIVSGLACLTRYIGVSCAVTGVAALFFFQKGAFRSKLPHLFLFGTISLAPLGVWAARNILQANTLMGDRAPARFPLYNNFYLSLISFFNWALPIEELGDRLKSTRAHLFLGAIAGYLAGAAWSPRNVWVDLENAICRIGPVMLFAGIYSTILIVVSTTTAHEGIGDRFLSPVFVPTVLIILFLVEKRLAGSAKSLSFRLFGISAGVSRQKLVVAVLVVWLAVPSFRVARTAGQSMQTGLGYNHVSWRTSDTISYLQEQLLSGGSTIRIYSNSPDAVYILSGASATGSPAAKGYKSSEPRRPIASLAGSWPASQPAFLVWFDDTHRPFLFDVEELKQIADLTVVARLADGTVYRVSSK